jgi:transcriptional repressor NrdR
LKCPGCRDLNNRVIDSRLGKDGDVIRRRRECERCGRRFTTYERVEELLPAVVKKDGRREPFDRLKIMAGLTKACEKRPVSVEAIEQVTDRIERTIADRGEKEVASAVIGEAVVQALRELDTVAYVRFASVYRSFQDIDEFMEELEGLIKERRTTKRSPAGRGSRPRAKKRARS